MKFGIPRRIVRVSSTVVAFFCTVNFFLYMNYLALSKRRELLRGPNETLTTLRMNLHLPWPNNKYMGVTFVATTTVIYQNTKVITPRKAPPVPKIPATLFSRYLINNPKICLLNNVTNSLTHIITVKSAVGHWKRRYIIRQTWASASLFPTGRVVFLIGTTGNKTLQNDILKESEKYGDIIQGDFLDTYRNLTLKGVMGLRWVTEFCSHAEIVLKTDDDITLNTFLFLRKYLSKFQTEKNPHLMMGHLKLDTPIERDKGLFWCLDEDEYWFRNEDIYPTYCNGLFVGLSMDLVKAMHRNAYETPFFWIDDVYMYGMLTKGLNVATEDLFYTVFYQGELDTVFQCYTGTVDCETLLIHAEKDPTDEIKTKIWNLILKQESRVRHKLHV